MADNVPSRDRDGANVDVSAEDLGGGVKVQRVRMQHGAARAPVDVSSSAPLPVGDAGGSLTIDDGGGSLTVDGTVGVTGVATAANQATVISHVDGIEGGIGAAADAAATVGSAGSLTAKLRLATTQLDAIQSAVQRLDDAISGSEMQVDVVASLPAGTNAIGKLAANSGVDIGDVDVTSLPGAAAHDAADTGTPLKVGGRARTALPVAVAQDDRVDAIHDKFGRRLAVVAPLDQRRSGTANFTGTSAADIIAAPGASVALVVTRILVVNAHATVGTKVTVRDGTTTKVAAYAAALGGGWTIEDSSGLFVAATNTAVTAICGTTGADVDVTVFGYTIPA